MAMVEVYYAVELRLGKADLTCKLVVARDSFGSDVRNIFNKDFQARSRTTCPFQQGTGRFLEQSLTLGGSFDQLQPNKSNYV